MPEFLDKERAGVLNFYYTKIWRERENHEFSKRFFREEQ